MTKEAIRTAALKRFAEQGYDATSMAEIAADVGIKAPAIYAHFKGKRELFHELAELVIEEDLNYAKKFLNQKGEAKEKLFAFLQGFGERFEETPNLRFLLTIYYLPPITMFDWLIKPIEKYNNNREIIITESFKLLPPCRIPPARLAAAYLGIIDSVQAEALYGGLKSFQNRLDAMWGLFSLAFEAD